MSQIRAENASDLTIIAGFLLRKYDYLVRARERSREREREVCVCVCVREREMQGLIVEDP